VSCPLERTTQNTGSTSVDDCTLPVCKAGSYLNSTANRCQLCEQGTYQPEDQQTSCLTCPSDTPTSVAGAVSQLLSLHMIMRRL
jgi:hypothetical protein